MAKKVMVLFFSLIIIIAGAIGGYFYFENENLKPKYGDITRNTTWKGEISVIGDIRVMEGVILTVAPGTIITIAVGEDSSNIGQIGPMDDMLEGDPTYDPQSGGLEYIQSHIQFQVDGKIICKGTPDARIVFKSAAEVPHYTDWQGIYVRYGIFEYVEVSHSICGIVAGGNFEKLTIEHSYIHNIWAAGIGYNNPADPNTQSYVRYTTIEDCGHEAVDTHSPGNLELSHNIVKNCQTGFNLHDFMNASVHHNLVLDTCFPILCVNASSVHATQNTFARLATQDVSRWTYNGYTMLQQSGPAGIFVTNEGTTHIIFTNSIIVDSPKGLRSESSSSTLENGYINFDNVTEQFTGSITPGAGITQHPSGFVDPMNDNYQLMDTSPLKGIGNPADGYPDLGAYG